MILDEILSNGLRKLKNKDSSLRIDNIIVGKSIYSMKADNSVFTDMNLCLVLLENAYGFAYFQTKPMHKYFRTFIGKEIPSILNLKLKPYFKVAITDAVYCLLNNDPVRKYKYFTGDLRSKATQRAVELLKNIPKGSSLVLIGAVREIIEEAHKKNINLTVVDLAPQKLGLELEGTRIIGGSKKETLKILMDAEYAIVSGMVFATNTADSIIKVAKENNVKLIFFMETGSNIGKELLNYGVEKVLSEYFPYYDFYGDTRYDVFTKSDENSSVT